MHNYYSKTGWSLNKITGDWEFAEHESEHKYRFNKTSKTWSDRGRNPDTSSPIVRTVSYKTLAEFDAENSHSIGYEWVHAAEIHEWILYATDTNETREIVRWSYDGHKNRWTNSTNGSIWSLQFVSGEGTDEQYIWRNRETGEQWAFDPHGPWSGTDSMHVTSWSAVTGTGAGAGHWRQKTSDTIIWEQLVSKNGGIVLDQNGVMTGGSGSQTPESPVEWAWKPERLYQAATETDPEVAARNSGWEKVLGTGEAAPENWNGETVWVYNRVRDYWEIGEDPVGGNGETADIIPLFPPTPFAQQHEQVSTAEIAHGSGTHHQCGSTGPYHLSDDPNSGYAGKLLENGILRTRGGDTITFTETTMIHGEVRIVPEDDLIIVIGDGSPDKEVTIMPYIDSDGTGTPGHLIFDIKRGLTVEVQVKNTLKLTPAPSVSSVSLPAAPFYVSVRGGGCLKFRLPSGKKVIFGARELVGTELSVLMDQTENDAVSERRSQVVFEKWAYGSDSYFDLGSVNSDSDQDSQIVFEKASSLIYCSPEEGGYGRVSCDPSNSGTGRLVFVLESGIEPGDGKSPSESNYFYGAGLNINGVYVPQNSEGEVENSALRTPQFYRPAGIRALFTITDQVAQRDILSDLENPDPAAVIAWNNRGKTDRRGLVLLNKNHSIPLLGANFERAASVQESKWAARNRYQNGCLIGVNGTLEVGDNLFLDYIGGASNQEVTSLHGGPEKKKRHNPSALIIDGYGPFAEGSVENIWEGARIELNGSGGVYLRNGASSQTGHMVTQTADDISGTIGTGVYNGVHAPVIDLINYRDELYSPHQAIQVGTTGAPLVFDESDQPTDLDGEHALEVMGPLTIISRAGLWGEAQNGFVLFPSLHRDHAGQMMPVVPKERKPSEEQ